MFLFAGEKEVLRAMEMLKGSVESGISLRKYKELLADARVEINILKRNPDVNKNFISIAEDCYESYNAVEKATSLEDPGNPPLMAIVRSAKENAIKKANDSLDKLYSLVK